MADCVDCDQQQPMPAIQSESLTDPATFVAPTVLASPRVVIEFCNRVRIDNSFPERSVVIRSCSADGEAAKVYVAAVALSFGTGFTEHSGWQQNFS